jgi:hypothetical protein
MPLEFQIRIAVKITRCTTSCKMLINGKKCKCSETCVLMLTIIKILLYLVLTNIKNVFYL